MRSLFIVRASLELLLTFGGCGVGMATLSLILRVWHRHSNVVWDASSSVMEVHLNVPNGVELAK